MTQEALPFFYLGPEGTYSHACAREICEYFGLKADLLVSCRSINDIHRAQIKIRDSLALFPVENALGGGISETLDGLFARHNTPIILLEWVLPIEHCLIGEGALEEVEEVRGHHQALTQCEEYLYIHLSKASKIEMSSNSAALISIIGEDPVKQKRLAGIASKEAAQLYNLPVIQEGINDFKNNCTRFWLVGSERDRYLSSPDEKQSLASIAFQMPSDRPGGLLRVLQAIANRGLNLTRIESRPTKGRLAEYTFFLDFAWPEDISDRLPELLGEIENYCSVFKFFGKYPILPDADPRFASA